ncbi:MAG: leucine-rich repeat domain-containing protein [Firmicutes bacterium]|nr:leucine-rich repeat domain-containing protein [Bacillota bacterium]
MHTAKSRVILIVGLFLLSTVIMFFTVGFSALRDYINRNSPKSVSDTLRTINFSALNFGEKIDIGIYGLEDRSGYSVSIGVENRDYGKLLRFRNYKLEVIGFGSGQLTVRTASGTTYTKDFAVAAVGNTLVTRLRDILGDTFTFADVASIHTLDISGLNRGGNCYHQKLSALRLFVNLHQLDISNNYLTDISFIAGLYHLSVLNISGNPLGNLFALQELRQLIVLRAENTALTSLTSDTGISFVGFERLNQLDLSYNPYITLSHLQNIALPLRQEIAVLYIDYTGVEVSGLIDTIIPSFTLGRIGANGLFGVQNATSMGAVKNIITEDTNRVTSIRAFGREFDNNTFDNIRIFTSFEDFKGADFVFGSYVFLQFLQHPTGARVLEICRNILDMTITGIAGTTFTSFGIDVVGNPNFTLRLTLQDISFISSANRAGIRTLGSRNLRITAVGQNSIEGIAGTRGVTMPQSAIDVGQNTLSISDVGELTLRGGAGVGAITVSGGGASNADKNGAAAIVGARVSIVMGLGAELGASGSVRIYGGNGGAGNVVNSINVSGDIARRGGNGGVGIYSSGVVELVGNVSVVGGNGGSGSVGNAGSSAEHLRRGGGGGDGGVAVVAHSINLHSASTRGGNGGNGARGGNSTASFGQIGDNLHRGGRGGNAGSGANALVSVTRPIIDNASISGGTRGSIGAHGSNTTWNTGSNPAPFAGVNGLRGVNANGQTWNL